MALDVVTNSVSGTGTVINSSSDLYVPQTVTVTSTDDNAIRNNAAGVQYIIDGNVFGSLIGIYSYDSLVNYSAAMDVTITINSTGTVGSDTYAIAVIGDGNTVINYGTIFGIMGVYIFAAPNTTNTVANYGSIYAEDYGILNIATGSLNLTNTGTIWCGQNSVNTSGQTALLNSGNMIGDIFFSGFADSYDGRLGTVKGTIFGNGGNDLFKLGLGTEIVDGGSDFDTLDFGSTTGITVNLANSTLNTLTAKGDTYSNIEQIIGSLTGADRLTGDLNANTLVGQGGNDSLDGAAGADSLIGGTGLDTLRGGAGTDSLTGGAGRDLLYGGAADAVRDVFIFTKTTESVVGTSRDMIYDFVRAIDDISLSGIDANTKTAGDQAFLWGGTTAKAFGVWITDTGTDILVRADINGDKVADMEILVKNVTTLSSGDFLL